jgi:hypothetical protein
VHHVVVVADRMQVHKGATLDAANTSPVLETHRMRFASRTLH